MLVAVAVAATALVVLRNRGTGQAAADRSASQSVTLSPTPAGTTSPTPAKASTHQAKNKKSKKRSASPRPGARHSARPPAHQRPKPSRKTLAPSSGALFGAYVQPTTGSNITAQESAVLGLERNIGRKIAIDQHYDPWNVPFPLGISQWDLAHGRIPMISWQGVNTRKILAGDYDAALRTRARQLRDLHGPVFLRWFAEMNGAVHDSDTISPALFIAAWRHVHQIFTSEGATNVRWVWCATSDGFGTGVAQRYYPGNSYVDWIGADGYNWAPVRPHAAWRSFAQIFSAFYRWGEATGLPMLVGEYGAVEGTPGAKAAWIRQTATQLRTQLPGIRAVVYFDDDHENYGEDFNWRVTSSASALAAFRAFATESYFMARPVS
jgi:hypothetical protein